MNDIAHQAPVLGWSEGDLLDLSDAFRRDGFVVVRNAVPPSLCAGAVAAFDAEVKTARRFYFLRHESGTYDAHVLTEHGFMKYPIMNLQDLPDRFAEFRQLGLRIVTYGRLRQIVAALLGEPGRCLHTMFFDGNQATWAHRDSDYLDSERIGAMVGLWVAGEDIHPGAGRFYLYRGSHRVAPPAELGFEKLHPNRAAYKQTLVAWLAGSGLEQVVPELKRGDAVLWNALTIHGALPTTAPEHSRKSFTAHYAPESHRHITELGQVRATRETVFNDTRIVLRGNQGAVAIQAKGALRAALMRYPALWRMTGGLRSALRRW
jgi:phytanoyl-CoA hydroxylase